jgi:hypothetical protein
MAKVGFVVEGLRTGLPGSLSANGLLQLLSPSRSMNDPVKMRIGVSEKARGLTTFYATAPNVALAVDRVNETRHNTGADHLGTETEMP